MILLNKRWIELRICCMKILTIQPLHKFSSDPFFLFLTLAPTCTLFNLSLEFPPVSLKDNLPHNTCQIYVKPHSKSTQMTLEYHIFDEKALE